MRVEADIKRKIDDVKTVGWDDLTEGVWAPVGDDSFVILVDNSDRRSYVSDDVFDVAGDWSEYDYVRYSRPLIVTFKN